MHAGLTTVGRTIVPTLRYRDVATAIDWLCNAFGFEKHLVVPGDDGAVRYAELTFGDGMIMVGPVEEADAAADQPASSGTQTCYLFVADVRAHCAAARAAGAEILLDAEDEASDGRGYSCRDLEGHIWNFGTYDPWKRQTANERRRVRIAESVGAGLRYLALVIGFMTMTFASAAVVAWSIGVNGEPPGVAGRASDTPAAAEQQEGADGSLREAMERALKDAREQLTRERTARESAERAARVAREQAAHEQPAKAGPDRTSADLREPTLRERAAIESAERIVRETREQLAMVERAAEAARAELAAERETRQAAERAGREARDLLAKERSAKDALERAGKETREQLAKEKERAARKAYPPRRRVAEPPPAFLWQ